MRNILFMSNSQEIFKKQIEPNIFIDESAIATYISKIAEIEQQSEHINIGYYDFPINTYWDYTGDENIQDGFLKMQKEKVLSIYNILKEAGIEKHLYSFCSILQTHCSRKILAGIIEPDIAANLNFSKEFYSLYKILSKDIKEIKIVTDKKDDTCVIKNLSLIKILLNSFKEQILTLDEVVEYIYDAEKGEVFDTMPENKLLDSAIINLLLYLQTKTTFVYNSEEAEVKKFSFTNRQFELLFELLAIVGLLNENDITSPPKDYLRRRTNYAFKKRPLLLKHFFTNNDNNSPKSLEIITDPEILAEADRVFEIQEKHKMEIANKIKGLLLD